MESEPLNQNPADRAFDELLRTRLAAPVLSDDGFSTRVLRALPASAARSARRRAVLITLGAGIGLAVGFRGDPHALATFWQDLLLAVESAVTWPGAECSNYLKLLLALAGAWWIFRTELRTLIDV